MADMDDSITPLGAEPTVSNLAYPLCIVSLNNLRKAIRDPGIDRGHLKVLANLSERFNAVTLTAWPGRDRIAEDEGMSPKTVEAAPMAPERPLIIIDDFRLCRHAASLRLLMPSVMRNSWPVILPRSARAGAGNPSRSVHWSNQTT
jgi:hypothetical protein